MLRRNVGVECHGDDIIGGVSSGGQGATSLARLVDGRQITHPLRNVASLHGLQPHLTERSTECYRGDGMGWSHLKVLGCDLFRVWKAAVVV